MREETPPPQLLKKEAADQLDWQLNLFLVHFCQVCFLSLHSLCEYRCLSNQSIFEEKNVLKNSTGHFQNLYLSQQLAASDAKLSSPKNQLNVDNSLRKGLMKMIGNTKTKDNTEKAEAQLALSDQHCFDWQGAWETKKKTFFLAEMLCPAGEAGKSRTEEETEASC